MYRIALILSWCKRHSVFVGGVECVTLGHEGKGAAAGDPSAAGVSERAARARVFDQVIQSCETYSRVN